MLGDPKVIILDEPTAALDPQSELDIYEKFNELTHGKTTIYISHRMVSATLADKIVVMKDGRVLKKRRTRK